MDSSRPGCLSGIFKIFLLDTVYKWLQRTIGFGSGSCGGCGCGFILFIIFIVLLLSIIFGTDWFKILMNTGIVAV